MTQFPPKSKASRCFIWMAIIAAFSGILFGFDTGVISGAILFIQKDFGLSPEMNGLVVSAVLMGALLGAIFSGRLTDRFGRKRLLVCDALIFAVGTILSALATSIVMLIAARLIVGVAIGIASYVAPLYISEISPPRHRGALVSLNQLAITVGILASYLVDYSFAGSGNWRWMFAVGVIPALILLGGMLFLPDSPRWMISKGRIDAAVRVLHRIRGPYQDVEREVTHIQETLKQQRGSWRLLFSRKIRPTIWIGCGLAVIQQITGINTIIYYAPTILQMAGFETASTAILATIGIGAVFVLFTVIALPLIDSWGRRPLLFLGVLGMLLSLLSLSWSFSGAPENMRWIAFVSMVVYIACFAFSLGPIMWLMISEIYPLRVRGLGSSLATCANWGSNWIVAVTFLLLIQNAGATVTFLLYAIVSIVSLWFIWTFVPETKGISLEHIEENLLAGKPMRQLGARIR